ncbi:FCSD flavin-binding domain-containing protein [Tepidamorphus sp. 3E244]|uniref:FCSD flavin-binding domain-containing protein n=1 Tax=Tepidamorphus sp. 3E244 TaxID=3385498 RepID=UPI0038FD38CA
MTGISRRRFAQFTLGTAAFTLAVPHVLRAQGKPKVVIIGGGAGGATAARYIAKDSEGAIDVTLIENSKMFTTCFFSNLYIGGMRTFESITHSYEKLASDYGITVVHQMANSVDRDAKEVTLADGSKVPYDRLIVSPGIDLIYDSVEGYSEEGAQIAPHAWKAGEQTKILKEKLDAVENGQQIVMLAPPNPYRCPPGPYERVSMMAHVLKEKGHTDSRIIVLDPKEKFSKQALFQEGWAKYYPGMVEWLGPDVHGGIKGVDVNAGAVETDFDTFSGALLNVIPAQKAGFIATDAGLANDSGFCPIDPYSMRSAMDENVYVIGDASIAGDMPKSGFSANSQAKVAAMAVRADLTDSKMFPARYANTCWSLIENEDAVKVGAQYQATDEKIASTSTFVSQTGESEEVREKTAEEAVGWYAGITADMFGTSS